MKSQMSSRALVTCGESHQVFQNRILSSRRPPIECSRPKLTNIILQKLLLYRYRYYAPPANLTQGGANLAQLSMTAQFYRQDVVTAANLTHVGLTWHKHARHCSDSKTETGLARFARRPLVMSFLLSLQCRACLCQVNPTWVRLAAVTASCL